MRGDDTSMNEGAADEDDDLLAQANALLEDDPISSAEKKILSREGHQIKKKVAFSIPNTSRLQELFAARINSSSNILHLTTGLGFLVVKLFRKNF